MWTVLRHDLVCRKRLRASCGTIIKDTVGLLLSPGINQSWVLYYINQSWVLYYNQSWVLYYINQSWVLYYINQSWVLYYINQSWVLYYINQSWVLYYNQSWVLYYKVCATCIMMCLTSYSAQRRIPGIITFFFILGGDKIKRRPPDTQVFMSPYFEVGWSRFETEMPLVHHCDTCKLWWFGHNVLSQ